MANVHRLKTWPEFFDAVARGEKRFEVRRNDRDFKTGDAVILELFFPELDSIRDHRGDTHEMWFRIGYMLHGPAFGIEDGYCVFSLEYLHT